MPGIVHRDQSAAQVAADEVVRERIALILCAATEHTKTYSGECVFE